MAPRSVERDDATASYTSSASGQPVLDFRDVGKHYESKRGSVEAVRAVTFSVAPGEFVSIVGRSGCGKSTLLKLAAGVLPLTSGEIRVKGEPVDGPVQDLGMVFQSPLLLEWRSVLANVVLPMEILRQDRSVAESLARALIHRVGLDGFEANYPWELSGGMQQRVAICRALITDPELLLMDEPFGALDALTREEMGAELIRLWQETKKTILFVTHNIEEAVFLSTKVVVMTPRPGSVHSVFDIDFPSQRSSALRFEPAFAEYNRRIHKAVYASGVS